MLNLQSHATYLLLSIGGVLQVINVWIDGWMDDSFKHLGINTTSASAPVSVELKETKVKDVFFVVFFKVNTSYISLLCICDLQASQSPIFHSTLQQEKCNKLVIMYTEGLLPLNYTD